MGRRLQGSCGLRGHGSWGPELVCGSESSSPVASLYRGVGTSPRTPPPAQIRVTSSHIHVGEVSSTRHLPCNDLAVPSCAQHYHRAQVSWDRASLFWRGGICPHSLASYPQKELPTPHLLRSSVWPQPSSTFTQTELEAPPYPPFPWPRGFPHCIDGEGTHPENLINHWQEWDEDPTKPVPSALLPPNS